MPLTREDILANEKFQKAPLALKLELLKSVDPDFNQLSPKEQGRIIFQSDPVAQKTAAYLAKNAPPEDKGFIGTLGEMASGLYSSVTDPKNFQLRTPTEAMADIISSYAPQFLHAGRAQQAFNQGNYVEAVPHALASITPGGPEAYQIGEEIANQQYGQAAAHALPFALAELGARGKVRSAASGFAKDVGTVSKETAKGSFKGATSTVPASVLEKIATGRESTPAVVRRATAGATMASPLAFAFGPVAPAVGAAIGAASPIAEGAFSGFKKGLKAARTNREIAASRSSNLQKTKTIRDMAKQLAAESREMPEVSAIPPESGYVRRTPVAIPEPETMPRAPAWQNLPEVAAQAKAETGSIPPPSGYVRKTPAPTPPPVRLPRVPAWQGVTSAEVREAPAVEPIRPAEGYVRQAPIETPAPQEVVSQPVPPVSLSTEPWAGPSYMNRVYNATVKVLGEQTAGAIFSNRYHPNLPTEAMDAIKAELEKTEIKAVKPQDPLTTALGNFRRPAGVYQDPGQTIAREFESTGRTLAARSAVAENAARGLKKEGFTADKLRKMLNGTPEQANAAKAKISAYSGSKQARYTPSQETIDHILSLLD